MQITGTDVKVSSLCHKIGFIGGSRAGTAFANYLVKSGANVQGFCSYNFNSATLSAKITQTKAYNDIRELVFDSDIIFISVKDTYIHNIWQQVRQFDLTNKFICHLSGFLSSSIFDDASNYCQGVASLHIPISFANKDIIPHELKSALFIVEGDESAIKVITQISKQNKVIKIPTGEKSKYHAACVFSSSLSLALLKNASNLIKDSFEINTEGQFAEQLVLNLVSSAINNSILSNNNILSAITGPIIRNDIDIVTSHLQALINPNDKILYKILSNTLVENLNLETQQKKSLQHILQVDTCLN